MNEEDESRVLTKLNHFKNNVSLTDGIAIQFQPTQWGGGNTEMEL